MNKLPKLPNVMAIIMLLLSLDFFEMHLCIYIYLVYLQSKKMPILPKTACHTMELW